MAMSGVNGKTSDDESIATIHGGEAGCRGDFFRQWVERFALFETVGH
jgi:hypothetical protein